MSLDTHIQIENLEGVTRAMIWENQPCNDRVEEEDGIESGSRKRKRKRERVPLVSSYQELSSRL